MDKGLPPWLIKRAMIAQANKAQREEFLSLGPYPPERTYSPAQRAWAIEKAREIGVRATARLLRVDRRTVQRWLRAAGVQVARVPAWLYPWVCRRRRWMLRPGRFDWDLTSYTDRRKA